MAESPLVAGDPAYRVQSGRPYESRDSATSWGAIVGGAVGAFALTVVLLAVTTGLGLASISPWGDNSTSATGFTVAAGVALVVIHGLSSGLGGYLAGRLRTKWTSVHADEVYFRDTAHGFLTWAAATVMMAVVMGSAISSAIGTGTTAVASVAAGAAQGAGSEAAEMLQTQQYGLDRLFRGSTPDAAESGADARAEAARILINGIRAGDVPPADRTYLAQMISARTGVPQATAEERVDAAIAYAKSAEIRAREAADAARKAASTAAFFTAVAMLIGAFLASAAAALGGSQRDAID